ncbi:hypothetical protein GCM10010220_03090 [Streptomyces parvulus]|nr:hypothetical protein GCM10010220_03090 [Streptomyces parvulus]
MGAGTASSAGSGGLCQALLSTLNTRFNLEPYESNGKSLKGSWQWGTVTTEGPSDAGCNDCGPSAG